MRLLIIALFALYKGMHEVVRASIVGSILGNLLLVLGGAIGNFLFSLLSGFAEGISTVRRHLWSSASEIREFGDSLADPASFSWSVQDP